MWKYLKSSAKRSPHIRSLSAHAFLIYSNDFASENRGKQGILIIMHLLFSFGALESFWGGNSSRSSLPSKLGSFLLKELFWASFSLVWIFFCLSLFRYREVRAETLCQRNFQEISRDFLREYSSLDIQNLSGLETLGSRELSSWILILKCRTVFLSALNRFKICV